MIHSEFSENVFNWILKGRIVVAGLLSIVIPAYNEEDNIHLTANTVLKVMDDAHIQCELVFVSDGSKDRTFSCIEAASRLDKRIMGLEFSRNFGKEAAILAGLEAGHGDCFVVMDCDLQHPPKTIVEMYRLWEDGYQIVEGLKNSRGNESFFHKKAAGLFYRILSGLTGFNMKDTSDFKLLDKQVTKQILGMPERKTFFRAMTFWVGFKSCELYYDVADRTAGVSKWSVLSLVKYAITNIISFSTIPLSLVTYIGTVALFFSFILGIQTLIRWCLGTAVAGFTTVILLLLILGGCILIGLGLIGRYIAAIYEEVKGRPRYIVCRRTEQMIPGGEQLEQ